MKQNSKYYKSQILTKFESVYCNTKLLKEHHPLKIQNISMKKYILCHYINDH